MTFKELNLIAPLQQALDAEGYTNPTPIQEQAIPRILSGKDLLGVAQTGTGKTAAFSLPLLQLLDDSKDRNARHIKALILTPTRELAIQIKESLDAYGRNLVLKSQVIFGGVPLGAQIKGLSQRPDILVATPGRLLDLIHQRYVDITKIGFFILDEADRMLDMGFIHDVKKIVALLPAKRQTLFFSATMPPEIQKLSSSLLYQPEKVEVTPVSSTAETIEQSLYMVAKKDKRKLLTHLLNKRPGQSVLVFTRTKHGADKVVKELSKDGIESAAIHGNKSQNARQRALTQFKTGELAVLIATDIASRGIDVDELSFVINYDLPEVPETYVHRIGRTGRAGLSGAACSFCDEEEMDYLKQIEKLIARKIPVVDGHPYPSPAAGYVVMNAPKGKDIVPRAGAIYNKNATRTAREKGKRGNSW